MPLIAVCIKQVPEASDGSMDPEQGVIIRSGQTRINPFDLTAIEAALTIRERWGGTVTAFSMGPARAEDVFREAFARGVDEGVLLSDSAFAGADILTTSLTLSEGMKVVGSFDLVVCGQQTTDGDTGAVGAAIASWNGVPGINGVREIIRADENGVILKQMVDQNELTLKVPYPTVISVDPEYYSPRMPSLKLTLTAKRKSVRVLTLSDLEDSRPERYGKNGSPTRVVEVFTPERDKVRGRLIQKCEDAPIMIVEIIQEALDV